MEYLILAYLGDAVFELYVRNALINKGIKNVNDLQNESIKYVSAKAQRDILERLQTEKVLTKQEEEIIKRARNTKMHKSKNNDVITYHKSTSFECLIGYLYNNDKKRLKEILESII